MELAQGALSALAVFLFPGYALLAAFRHFRQRDLVEVLCAAAGVSIAVVPLLLGAFTILGWPVTPAVAAAVMALLGIVTVADILRRSKGWRPRWSAETSPYHIGLALVFAMTLIARIWMVRGIEFPLWTDSYHHTLIADLIASQGAVPASYGPYAPVTEFTYHFSFHALAAWFHWLSGASVPRAVVVVGQVINALVVPTTYLFGWRLMKSRRAALVAALIVGLLSTMPTRFVNWGRYPQLAGQVLLPVLVVLTIDAFESRKVSLSKSFLVAAVAAGLFLVHNRMTLFYMAFAGLLFVLYAVRERRRRDQVGRLFLSGVLMLVLALLIDAPWLMRFFSGFGASVAQQTVAGYRPETAGTYFTFTTDQLFHAGMHPVWLVLGGLSAAWGLVRRKAGVWLLVGWVLILLAAANLHLVGVPPFFSTLIVAIYLYLPVAVLVGHGADQLAGAIMRSESLPAGRARKVAAAGLAVLFVAAGLYGMVYTARVIEPDNGFVRPADLKAMAWIRGNTAEDARFYVANQFWTPMVAHGLDAGYWIPYLAGRQTMMPPEVYSNDGSAAYIASTNKLLRDLAGASTTQQVWQTMRENQLTHVYIGNRPTYLKSDFFDADGTHFRPVYTADGVWIYEATR